MLLVADVRTHLTLSLGSSIRTLFLGLALLFEFWVTICDVSSIPRDNASAKAGGGDDGALHVVSEVIDRICSHIGTSADGLYIFISWEVLMYRFGP